MLSSGLSVQRLQWRERKAGDLTSISSSTHRLDLDRSPPSALQDPQTSWGGSDIGWAPWAPPLPSRDRDMTQISYCPLCLCSSCFLLLLWPQQRSSKEKTAYLPKRSMRIRFYAWADADLLRTSLGWKDPLLKHLRGWQDSPEGETKLGVVVGSTFPRPSSAVSALNQMSYPDIHEKETHITIETDFIIKMKHWCLDLNG